MRRIVYVATGSPEQAALDLKRLRLTETDVSLFVMAPPDTAPRVAGLASLECGQILVCKLFSMPKLWLRLAIFLGFSSRSEIICLRASGQSRSLKLLALMLPARLFFSDGQESLQYCSRLQLLRSAIAAKGPLCVMGSASPERLQAIAASVRQRYPNARLHGVIVSSPDSAVTSLFDSFDSANQSLFWIYLRLLPRCVGKRRFQGLVLPCTKEGFSGLKWLAWLLPVWRIEAYNEHLDVFSARNLFSLVCHAWWRTRESWSQKRQARWRRRERRLRKRQRLRHQEEYRRRSLPVGVLGSASAYYLKQIIPVVRGSFPGVEVYGLLPPSLEEPARDLFDSCDILRPGIAGALHRCWAASRREFQAWIVPCTDEPYAGMKLLSCLPVFGPRHIYNELGDGFPVRDLPTLYRHFTWRLRERRRSLPVGVLGSASAYYLKQIIPVVRGSFPGVEVYGLLPPSLEEPARDLFDSCDILRPGITGVLRRCWAASRREFQAWIVPCTNEPYAGMKWLSCLPIFGPRHIYNELGDGFPVRDLPTLYHHFTWRLRERLSFQVLSSIAGESTGVRMLHLLAYFLRLMLGAGVLLKVRLLSSLRRPPLVRAGVSGPSAPSLDLIYLDAEGGQEPYEAPSATIPVHLTARIATPRGAAQAIRQINAAIGNSHADWICLLDSRCRMGDQKWLDRLLETFDERTAQVGPQILNPADGSALRGGLLDGGQSPRWNSDNAVCWHMRPEWLAVEALPWVCVVLRRSVFLKTGYFRENCAREPIPVDLDFCRRLAAQGWRSICNQSVSVSYPTGAAASELEPVGGVSGAFRRSEDRS